MNPAWTTGLAWLGLLADPVPAPIPVPAPAPPAAALPAPQVIRWADGYVIVNGQEVIYRRPGAGPATNVISGSGNGFGNTVIVDNAGGSGTTIVRNARNGIGNRVVIDPSDPRLDLPPGVFADPPAAPPAPVCHRGKESKFWTKKVWSDGYDCNLYWDPKAERWFRYQREDDTYRPVPPDYDPAQEAPPQP